MIQPITLNGSNVTAENDAYINHAIHRTDGIVEFGNSMSAEIITNNSIKIKDGLLINQGRYMRIVPGSYETVAIENGKSGVNRIDLIVARFVADGATETHTIEVVKGDANGNKPTATTGDTFNGATINEIPLYSVHLTGLNITKVQRELNLIKNTSDVVHMGYDSEGKPLAQNFDGPRLNHSTYDTGWKDFSYSQEYFDLIKEHHARYRVMDYTCYLELDFLVGKAIPIYANVARGWFPNDSTGEKRIVDTSGRYEFALRQDGQFMSLQAIPSGEYVYIHTNYICE